MNFRYPSKAKLVYLICFIMAALAWFSGCVGGPKKPPPEADLYLLPDSEYPVFEDDRDYDGLLYAAEQSMSYLSKIPPERTFRFGNDYYTAAHMLKSLERFTRFIAGRPSLETLNRFIKSEYYVYKSVGDNGYVLFTGYYEPLLRGSPYRTDVYRYPIYGRPYDLLEIDLSAFSPKWEGEKIYGRYTGDSVIPYHDRKEIDEGGVLDGKAQPIAWVDDRVALFFLHIQGSGKIALTNGQTINIHYAAKNGRPYRSIGSLLIEENKISKEEMSMQRIRQYLESRPYEADRILNYNPSYVFFSTDSDSIRGAINVPLTPGRSVACDRKVFPISGLMYIETEKPLIDGFKQIYEWTAMNRFALHQDVGGAVIGPGRADLFWGSGDYAEIAAGHMKQPGNIYYLVLKP